MKADIFQRRGTGGIQTSNLRRLEFHRLARWVGWQKGGSLAFQQPFEGRSKSDEASCGCGRLARGPTCPTSLLR